MLDFPASNMPDYEDPTFDIGGTHLYPFVFGWTFPAVLDFAAKGPFPLCLKSKVLTSSKSHQISSLVPSLPKALGTQMPLRSQETLLRHHFVFISVAACRIPKAIRASGLEKALLSGSSGLTMHSVWALMTKPNAGLVIPNGGGLLRELFYPSNALASGLGIWVI